MRQSGGAAQKVYYVNEGFGEQQPGPGPVSVTDGGGRTEGERSLKKDYRKDENIKVCDYIVIAHPSIRTGGATLGHTPRGAVTHVATEVWVRTPKRTQKVRRKKYNNLVDFFLFDYHPFFIN